MGIAHNDDSITTEQSTTSVCGRLVVGWKLPTDTQWTDLQNAGATGWSYPGNKFSGIISGLPGYRSPDGTIFFSIGTNGFWWSATRCIYRSLNYINPTVNSGCGSLPVGFSVVCLKN